MLYTISDRYIFETILWLQVSLNGISAQTVHSLNNLVVEVVVSDPFRTDENSLYNPVNDSPLDLLLPLHLLTDCHVACKHISCLARLSAVPAHQHEHEEKQK